VFPPCLIKAELSKLLKEELLTLRLHFANFCLTRSAKESNVHPVSFSFPARHFLGWIRTAPLLHMVRDSNPLQPVSVAIAFANALPHQTRRGWNGRHSLLCLAAAGVLAFLFSAASPEDDLIQQEFVRTRKSVQSLVVSWKVVHAFAVAAQTLSVIRSLPVAVRDTWIGLVDDSSSSLPPIPSASPAGERPPPALHS